MLLNPYTDWVSNKIKKVTKKRKNYIRFVLIGQHKQREFQQSEQVYTF